MNTRVIALVLALLFVIQPVQAFTLNPIKILHKIVKPFQISYYMGKGDNLMVYLLDSEPD